MWRATVWQNSWESKSTDSDRVTLYYRFHTKFVLWMLWDFHNQPNDFVRISMVEYTGWIAALQTHDNFSIGSLATIEMASTSSKYSNELQRGDVITTGSVACGLLHSEIETASVSYESLLATRYLRLSSQAVACFIAFRWCSICLSNRESLVASR